MGDETLIYYLEHFVSILAHGGVICLNSKSTVVTS